ncbi:MAG: alpha/beta fold hydrolase [Euryarchaeota archaeon]|nr:alpha/beta fold hydrolase [Euryarchaeota archaeon]
MLPEGETLIGGGADGSPMAPTLPGWLRPHYPFPTRKVAVEGGKMSTVDTGRGPPVVLLHGNPTWSYMYRAAIRLLQGRHRVIAPDHLGFGLSDKPPDPGDYTLEGHIRRLQQVVDRLDLEKFDLVCHDWGGPIGLALAEARPERVRRLVLMNTWAFLPRGMAQGLVGLATLPARLPLVGETLLQRWNLLVRLGIPLGMFRRDRATPDLVRAYKYPFRRYEDRAGVLAFPRMIPVTPADETWARMESIENGLPGLRQPTLLLWGQRDPVFGPRTAYRFRRELRNSRGPHLIPDASHFVTEDAPGRTSRAIAKFLGR